MKKETKNGYLGELKIIKWPDDSGPQWLVRVTGFDGSYTPIRKLFKPEKIRPAIADVLECLIADKIDSGVEDAWSREIELLQNVLQQLKEN